MHVCGGCRRSLPRTDEHFHNAYGRKDGLATWCKACMCKSSKEYEAEKRRRLRAQRAIGATLDKVLA